jgi:RNA polymerase sigma factor (sigma-70 family)
MDRTRINALMDRACSGDGETFATLAALAQDELYRLALACGLSREDAAETTQEALLRAYAGRAAWRDGADAMAWLCGITMNVVRECQRRQRRRNVAWFDPRRRQASARAEADDADGNDAADLDQLQLLRAAVGDLPPRQREAIACRYLRRMSIRQTAATMGCAEGTVKSAVAAALKTLRNVLQRQP